MCASVARGTVMAVRVVRDVLGLLGRGVEVADGGGDERAQAALLATVSARGVRVGEAGSDASSCAKSASLMHFSFVSASTSSMAWKAMSNAFRKSPVCDAIFLEISVIAVDCRKGMKSAATVESEGRSDRARDDKTDAICGAVYGKNGSNAGLRFLAFRRGKKRSVRSRAFAIPIRMSLESLAKDHSKKLQRVELSRPSNWSISSRTTSETLSSLPGLMNAVCRASLEKP